MTSLNCKPGDVAECFSTNPRYRGRRFRVLFAAPLQDFKLPNGQPHAAGRPDDWVLQSLDGPVSAALQSTPCSGNDRIETVYGVGADRFLAPVPEVICSTSGGKA